MSSVKKDLCLLLCCIVSFMFALPMSAEVIDDNLLYNIEEENVTITGYKDQSATEVIIPEYIEGCPVVAIGEYAFEFMGSLRSLTLPESLLEIDDFAFIWCEALEKITIPPLVEYIGEGIFYGCTNLQSINVSSRNDMYSSQSGVLYTKDIDWDWYETHETERYVLGTLVAYPAGKTNTSFSIPNTVYSIKDNAFAFSRNLKTVTMNGKLEEIGDRAFYNSPIRSITIPSSMAYIEDFAFERCDELSLIIFNGEPTDETANENFGCNALIWAKPGNGWEAYLATGFKGCKVIIGDYLARLDGNIYGAYCLGDEVEVARPRCENFKEWQSADIVIGDAQKTAETLVFAMPAKDVSIIAVAEVLYTRDDDFEYEIDDEGRATITRYNGSSELVIIPPNIGLENAPVVAIGDYAFEDYYTTNEDKSLTVILPDTIEYIGNYAFYYSDQLKSIKIQGEPPALGYSAFNSYNITIYANPGMGWEGMYSFGGCHVVIGEPPVYFGQFKCQKADGKITIIEYLDRKATEVIIPAYIEDCPVTAIGSGAFEEMYSLQSVTLPETLEEIGEEAFSGCESLLEITIPANVVSIKDWAFDDCDLLAKVELNEGLKEIGAYAFCSTSLESFAIPASVEKIGINPVMYCEELQSIDVDAGNEHFVSVDGVLYDKNMQNLIAYPAGKTDITFEVPATVQALLDDSFRDCLLQSVTLNEGLVSIGAGVFKYSENLESILLPSTVTEIGDYAFAECSFLKSVTLNEGLVSIGEYVFEYGENLESIVIPASVTLIGNSAFTGCKQLKFIQFEGTPIEETEMYSFDCSAFIRAKPGLGWEEYVADGFGGCRVLIGDYLVFLNDTLCGAYCQGDEVSIPLPRCENFKEWQSADIVIGDAQKTAETLVFAMPANDVALSVVADVVYTSDSEFTYEIADDEAVITRYLGNSAKVIIPPNIGMENAPVCSIGEDAFEDNYYIQSVKIPSTVKHIEDEAFESCYSLTEINLPDSLKEIGSYAFAWCESLKEINIPAYVESIGKNAFKGMYSLSRINVALENEHYCDVDGVLFDKNITELVCFPDGFEFENNRYEIPASVREIGDSVFYNVYLKDIEIILPENLETIGDYAFDYCEINDAIVIPAKVLYIGNYAFAANYQLDSIYFLGEPPEIDWRPFGYDNGNATIYALPGMGWEGMETFGDLPVVIITEEAPAISRVDGLEADTFEGELEIRIEGTPAIEGSVLRYSLGGDYMQYTAPFAIDCYATVTAAFFSQDGKQISPIAKKQYFAINRLEQFDSDGLEYSYYGESSWTVQENTGGFEKVAQVKSPDNGNSTLLVKNIKGQGTISFSAKMTDSDSILYFIIDGKKIASIDYYRTWQRFSFDITSDGDHDIAWVFTENEYGDWYSYAMVADVVWEPLGEKKYSVEVDGKALSMRYLPGEEVTVEAQQIKGRKFVKWSAEGIELADASANPLTFAMPENDVNLTADYFEFAKLNVPLHCGWNLVAMPADLDDEQNIDLFDEYRPLLFAAGGKGFRQAEFPVKAGQALWLFSRDETSETLVFNREISKESTLPECQKGWNAIGVIGEKPVPIPAGHSVWKLVNGKWSLAAGNYEPAVGYMEYVK